MSRRICKKFVLDSPDKFQVAYYAITYSRQAHECIYYMLEEYPEMIECSHENIAEILGFNRETVCRAINRLKKDGKVKNIKGGSYVDMDKKLLFKAVR